MANTILVPVDLRDRENAEKVIDSAILAARVAEAGLSVMSVVPDVMTGIDLRYAIRGENAGSIEFDKQAMLDGTLAELNAFVEERLPSDMEVDTIVRHGTVYEQVLKVAEEIDATQIVMGAQDRGITDFLLGSNASIVVRHAKCSVNVVR